MRKPPPGMKSMPLKPGETKSQYMDRVRATKPTGTGGGRRSDMAPTPATSTTPRPKGGGTVKPVVTPPRPISPKGGAGTGGGRGTAPRPGYGGGKPRRMKTGGMVKGKK